MAAARISLSWAISASMPCLAVCSSTSCASSPATCVDVTDAAREDAARDDADAREDAALRDVLPLAGGDEVVNKSD